MYHKVSNMQIHVENNRKIFLCKVTKLRKRKKVISCISIPSFSIALVLGLNILWISAAHSLDKPFAYHLQDTYRQKKKAYTVTFTLIESLES